MNDIMLTLLIVFIIAMINQIAIYFILFWKLPEAHDRSFDFTRKKPLRPYFLFQKTSPFITPLIIVHWVLFFALVSLMIIGILSGR